MTFAYLDPRQDPESGQFNPGRENGGTSGQAGYTDGLTWDQKYLGRNQFGLQQFTDGTRGGYIALDGTVYQSWANMAVLRGEYWWFPHNAATDGGTIRPAGNTNFITISGTNPFANQTLRDQYCTTNATDYTKPFLVVDKSIAAVRVLKIRNLRVYGKLIFHNDGSTTAYNPANAGTTGWDADGFHATSAQDYRYGNDSGNNTVSAGWFKPDAKNIAVCGPWLREGTFDLPQHPDAQFEQHSIERVDYELGGSPAGYFGVATGSQTGAWRQNRKTIFDPRHINFDFCDMSKVEGFELFFPSAGRSFARHPINSTGDEAEVWYPLIPNAVVTSGKFDVNISGKVWTSASASQSFSVTYTINWNDDPDAVQTGLQTLLKAQAGMGTSQDSQISSDCKVTGYAADPAWLNENGTNSPLPQGWYISFGKNIGGNGGFSLNTFTLSGKTGGFSTSGISLLSDNDAQLAINAGDGAFQNNWPDGNVFTGFGWDAALSGKSVRGIGQRFVLWKYTGDGFSAGQLYDGNNGFNGPWQLAHATIYLNPARLNKYVDAGNHTDGYQSLGKYGNPPDTPMFYCVYFKGQGNSCMFPDQNDNPDMQSQSITAFGFLALYCLFTGRNKVMKLEGGDRCGLWKCWYRSSTDPEQDKPLATVMDCAGAGGNPRDIQTTTNTANPTITYTLGTGTAFAANDYVLVKGWNGTMNGYHKVLSASGTGTTRTCQLQASAPGSTTVPSTAKVEYGGYQYGLPAKTNTSGSDWSSNIIYGEVYSGVVDSTNPANATPPTSNMNASTGTLTAQMADEQIKLAKPSGTPNITGTATVGSTLTANPGTWTPSGSTLSYQWYRDGRRITGATAATYVLVTADAGTSIVCVIQGVAPDSGTPAVSHPPGFYRTAQKDIAGSSGPGVPVLSTAPSVSASVANHLAVSETVTTTNGTWSNTPTSFTYQWMRDGTNITTGGTSTQQTYTIQAADINHNLSVKVTAVNATGSSVPATSSNAVTIPFAPANTIAPAVTDVTTGSASSAAVGDVLTSDTGTWTDASTFAYSWIVNSVAQGAQTPANQYTVQLADATKPIICRVTATGTGGSTAADSNTITVVGVPVVSINPTISGSNAVGGTLTSDTGTWSNSPTGYAYQWKSNGTNISGATTNTFTVLVAQAGTTITCQVTATNTAGSGTPALSNGLAIPSGAGASILGQEIQEIMPMTLATGQVGASLVNQLLAFPIDPQGLSSFVAHSAKIKVAVGGASTAQVAMSIYKYSFTKSGGINLIGPSVSCSFGSLSAAGVYTNAFNIPLTMDFMLFQYMVVMILNDTTLRLSASPVTTPKAGAVRSNATMGGPSNYPSTLNGSQVSSLTNIPWAAILTQNGRWFV